MTHLRSLVVCLLAASLVLLAPRRAGAQEDSAVSMDAATRHFEEGQERYARGEYAGAADEFLAAWEARNFPAFLYNAAVARERQGDLKAAAELFRRYLAADPGARDRASVEKRVAALEERLRPPEPPPTTQPGTGPDTPPVEPPPATQPAVTPPPPLPEVKPKGLVVIESKPAGATIYLDDKHGEPLGRTPWNGSIDGPHTVILESKGHETERVDVAPGSDKLLWIYMALREEHVLGWLEVRANVPGASVFLDRRDVGAVGRTPFLGNVQPGRHTIIVSREGYEDVERAIEIARGKAHTVEVTLEPARHGYVAVAVENVEGAQVRLDGQLVCPAPGGGRCRFQAPAGRHRVTVGRGGRKLYGRTLEVGRATESTLQVQLAPRPSRADAIWQFVFAGGFVAGGYFLGDYAAGVEEEQTGDILTYTSYGLYGLGGLTFVTGVWYLVRDKGPSSTGRLETRSLALHPAIGPGRAGVGAVWRF